MLGTVNKCKKYNRGSRRQRTDYPATWMGSPSGLRESRAVPPITSMVPEVFLGMVTMAFLPDKTGTFCGVSVKKELQRVILTCYKSYINVIKWF